jgi:DNA-binding NarL/FixJ family response regulator
VIVDDHPMWLDGLERLLEHLELRVVGRATRRSEAEQLIVRHRPDMLIADASVIATEETTSGAPDSREIIRRAREANPNVKCIMLSEQDDLEARELAFAAGASVFCVKRAVPEDLAAAIRQSFDHCIYFADGRGSVRDDDLPARDVGAPTAAGLTKREVEILRLAAEGYSNSELARMLWVTEQTVKFHLSNVYRKLNVANRTEASRWAQLHGLLGSTPATPTSVAA